ncbi:MAG TPA: hypothetical protein VMP68_13600 [Candidatus Eisenbacteria bacterium]|nr:hypothetical protein [Candidatus Eisenbacteria bacterium]
MRKPIAMVVVAVLAIIVIRIVDSCDEKSSTTQPASVENPTTVQPSLTTEIALPEGIAQLDDGYLQRTLKQTLSGTDHRPFWVLQGRVFNMGPDSNKRYYQIHRVTIHVTLTDNSDLPIDETDLDLSVDIPPFQVRGFEEEIRLLPPVKGAYKWQWEIVSAKGQITQYTSK